MNKTIATMIFAGALMASALPAQTTPAPKKGEVETRKDNQQKRIANGVKSGALTPSETANLEKKEAAINRETAADRAANGGKLTPAERRQVNRQQDRVSKEIYNKKHNTAVQK